MVINFTTQVWKEGEMYVSYAPELDISSCGETVAKAKKNLLEAVECFLETAEKMGTLMEILEEAGFSKRGRVWEARKVVSVEKKY
jgi:predicted RNase H-like HicB family nuclease